MSKYRGEKFFPQFSPLARKLEEITEPVTDRGATGPLYRDGEDVRERVEKQRLKKLRRARAAGHNV